MQIRNVDPLKATRSLTIEGRHVTVGPDEAVEVDDELGARLLAQPDVWAEVIDLVDQGVQPKSIKRAKETEVK